MDIKSCPFCGNKAVGHEYDRDDRSVEFKIECTNCMANMWTYIAYGSEAIDQNKKQELIYSWNTRINNGH